MAIEDDRVVVLVVASELERDRLPVLISGNIHADGVPGLKSCFGGPSGRMCRFEPHHVLAVNVALHLGAAHCNAGYRQNTYKSPFHHLSSFKEPINTGSCPDNVPGASGEYPDLVNMPAALEEAASGESFFTKSSKLYSSPA